MRSPSRPNLQDSKASDDSRLGPQPSYPDRQRIDSDVRAFMRPVSTPWITFDRESRVDLGKVAIRAGVGFESTPDFRKSSLELPPQVLNAPAGPSAASRLAETNAMFPPSIPNQKAAEDPSSLIVAKDVVPQLEEPIAVPATPKPSRLGFMALTAGIVGIAAGAAFALTHQPASYEGIGTLAAAPPPVAAPVVVPAREPIVEAPAPTAAPAAPVDDVVGEKATDPNKRFGHLTIKGDATKGKSVWFDSKRMLGKGERSFLVFCGMHQMAITDGSTTRVTADTLAKDVEVPCNGELVVGK